MKTLASKALLCLRDVELTYLLTEMQVGKAIPFSMFLPLKFLLACLQNIHFKSREMKDQVI